MNKKKEEILIGRIERFRDNISRRILGDSTQLKAKFYHCPQPVAFEDRLAGKYKSIVDGQSWGKAWDSAWFHLTGQVPQSWCGNKVVAQLDFSGEGLVYNGKGEMLQGITDGSVFDKEFSRDVVRLIDKCKGNESIDLWVETAANGLFGVFTEQDPAKDSPNRYGSFDARVNSIRLCTFDEELWHFWLDIKILHGLIKTLPAKTVRRARIIRCVSDTIDEYADNRENLHASQLFLNQELKKTASASDLSVTAVGHAHIDTAWLWPVKETIRKCARTFSSQIDLIEKYPDYIFGASQPQHYAFVKEHYPALYEKIKTAVKAGRWEVQGGMWVEADCNLISGESMIRQILHGKNFFKDEFKIDVKNLWLPDVFGYSAALPQILKKSGIDYFLTQKMSWNQFNEMPHHSFMWQGLDGSEVLTHFPPENNYNSQLGTDYLVPAQEHFKEKEFLDEFISLFGVGDGGGGPKEENIELGLRMKSLESAPRVSFGTAEGFFERLNKHKDKLPRWVGELYLELHRGTLTSQAKVKKANRRLEHELKTIEWLYSCLPLDDYPREQLDSIWKKVLLNQFHDIIPGSSITEVYRVTHDEHESALSECNALIDKFALNFFDSDEDSLTVANILHYPYKGAVELPSDWSRYRVTDAEGNDCTIQNEACKAIALVEIPPYSMIVLKRAEKTDEKGASDCGLILENDLIRYEFNGNGQLIRALDKEFGKEILEPEKNGNVLTLYDDHPNNWDAWDIDFYYENCAIESFEANNFSSIADGKVRKGLKFTGKIGKSEISQSVFLESTSKRLGFYTKVDWREKHRMLRVAFPVAVRAEQASYDIQYGYVRRNTHRNTSWDMAQFEVAGHKYADLSDNDYGVALLNDCKYGYKINNNTIDLNLLRSPNYPDPDADMGEHEFTYCLYPHAGDLIRSDVIAEASILNQPPLVFNNCKIEMTRFPWRLEGNGLSLEVVKAAEKEECLIIRIIETLGKHSKGTLYIDDKDLQVLETDLMEWFDKDSLDGINKFKLLLEPFEIRSYKLTRN